MISAGNTSAQIPSKSKINKLIKRRKRERKEGTVQAGYVHIATT